MVSRGKRVVEQLARRCLVDLRGEDDGSQHADNVFLYVFQKFRLEHNLSLITQDAGLARDLVALDEKRLLQ